LAFSLVYDNSRGPLLRGRKTMLKVCAAQLKEQIATGMMTKKPIWIDLGGGTGKKKIHAFQPVIR
jgi:betaine lipid synthase